MSKQEMRKFNEARYHKPNHAVAAHKKAKLQEAEKFIQKSTICI